MQNSVQHRETRAGVAEPADSPRATSGRISWGEFGLAVVLLALGVAVILDGLGQPESTSASGIGAGFFPLIVGGVMVVVSAVLIVQVLRGKRGEPEDAEGDVDVSTMNWWQVGIVVVAIVFFIVTLDLLGYMPAAAITFWAIAFAMGARHHVRSAIIAVVLSVAVYLLFTLALRITLPTGFLEGIL